MIIDAHAHVNFNAYKKDAPEVIRRALDNNTWLINAGSQITTSERAVEIANQYPQGVYACVGLHPIHLSDFSVDEDEHDVHFKPRQEKFDYDAYYKLAQNKKVVGIGEIGLDFFHLDSAPPDQLENLKKQQKEIFIKQIDLAREVGLPLMLHCRGSRKNPEDAYWEMLEILREEKSLSNSPFAKGRELILSPFRKGGQWGISGVIHCFTSTLEIAKAFIDLGFCVGFTGIVTYSNAKDVQKVATELPLEKIIIETDCPYLAPQPVRGQRNEPLYVKHVAEKIATLKKFPLAEVEKTTFENTLRVFSKII
ncbi:MAG: TatD family hydrolase [bacterium]|nr:TatD family hydrolase [bacterium]